MAIKPICGKCKKELTRFGAILFGPPDERDIVQKHIYVMTAIKS